jgi:hydroxymethylpyrimidine/phosphomethylpyrimidine kinase
VHGTCAITAVTAQNTLGVSTVHQLPPEMILAQVRAVVQDIGVDAVKVGMLASAAVALAVAAAIDELPPGTPVVVDPVMVAESGARLLGVDAHDALVGEILPRASVLTPNLPEARVLAGRHAPDPTAATRPEHDRSEAQWDAEDAEVEEDEEAREAEEVREDAEAREAEEVREDAEAREAEELAAAVLALGPRVVVLTGGHRTRAVDLFLDSEKGSSPVLIEGRRHPDGAAHGSGCTHSSLLAAQLALGQTPLQAARVARELAGVAVAQGLRDLGAGAGPVDVLGLAGIRGE